MKNPTIYILCGVHNNLEYTKELLKCINNSDYKKIKSIIIDDGSIDGTNDFIEKNYPQTIVLQGDGNLWWTGAVVMGINYILDNSDDDDYVLTINNDCTFGKNYIRTLVNFVKDKKNTIAGSLVVDKTTGKIVDGGVRINWGKAVFEPIHLSEEEKKHNIYVNVDTLSTKGTIFPTKVFKEIGNFDKTNFPHYLSDYEYTCRAKKADYKLLLNYASIVVNDNLRTGKEIENEKAIKPRQLKEYLFSKKSKINISDQMKFFIKYCPNRYKPSCYFALFKKSLYLLSLLTPFYQLKKMIFFHKNA